MAKSRKLKKPTMKEYEELLNECGVPEDDKMSNGGRINDLVKYGNWVRRNDPIMFRCGYLDYVDGWCKDNNITNY